MAFARVVLHSQLRVAPHMSSGGITGQNNKHPGLLKCPCTDRGFNVLRGVSEEQTDR